MDAWRDSTDTFERLPDGTWAPAPYDENMADGSTPVAWEDVADPMDPKPDRTGCALVTLEDAEDHHRVLLVKGVTVCELLRDWTGYDYVD